MSYLGKKLFGRENQENFKKIAKALEFGKRFGGSLSILNNDLINIVVPEGFSLLKYAITEGKERKALWRD